MELIIAKKAGFCYGVAHAINEIYKALDQSNKIYSYGVVIHNKTITDEFLKRGVKVINSIDEIEDSGGIVMIRAHGVPRSVFADMEKKNIKYIDLTCKDVKRIHDIVSQVSSDEKIIILGDKNHVEVIGHMGWVDALVDFEDRKHEISGRSIVFENLQEIVEFDFDLSYNYNLVSQTTFSCDTYQKIIGELSKKGIKLKIFDTICTATSDRQKEADGISRIVDKMIVLGDQKSSNSKKLYEICKKNCPDTYFIESIHDLQLNIFKKGDKIGITAGASTPPVIIKEAVSQMSEFDNSINNDNNVVEPNVVESNVVESNVVESFEDLLNERLVALHKGNVVTGTVLSVTNGEVFVNLGYKSDGVIQKGDFSDDPEVNPADLVKPGDPIDVYIVHVNDSEGIVLLSKKRVASIKGMEDIENAAGTDTIVSGRVVEIVKGGMIASISGVRAFVPSSQVSDRFIADLSVFKGKVLEFNILEVDKGKRKVVAGRKVLAKKQSDEKKKEVYEKLQVGEKIEGTVSRLTDFGAFVDLGGVDGLIHISELSWARVKKASDVLAVGDAVTVIVVDVNKEKEKISLSLKGVTGNPWDTAAEKYEIGKIVSGKVVRLVPFGAFVELEQGIDGLVHISQISNKRIETPESALKIGEIIDVKITDIDFETKKISLSKKAAEEPEYSPEDLTTEPIIEE